MKRLLLNVALILGVGVVAHSAERASIRTVIASTTPVLVATGPGMVYGVVLSSGASYAVLRDSATANASSTPLVPHIGFSSTPQVLKFDPPIPFSNGLSVNLGAATAQEGVTVLYQKGRY